MAGLTPREVGHYRREGFLSPLRAFSREEALALRGKLEASAARHGPFAIGKNGFGIGYNPARGDPETSDDYRIYEWAYGTEPPNNTYNTIGPPLRTLFNGIHLAGENLTPSTFRDGLYR